MSSIYGTFHARYITDGKHSPEVKHFYHANPGPSWVSVNLRRPERVGKVVFWNRGDDPGNANTGGQANGAQIYGQDESGRLHPCGCVLQTLGPGYPIVRECGPQRVVAIRVADPNDLQIAELEAYPAANAGTYVLIDKLAQAEQIINLAEVEAYDITGARLAPISADVVPEHSNFPASYLIDGDVNNFGHSRGYNAGEDPHAIVRYSASPHTIVVRNRVDNPGRIMGATINLVVDGNSVWSDTFGVAALIEAHVFQFTVNSSNAVDGTGGRWLNTDRGQSCTDACQEESLVCSEWDNWNHNADVTSGPAVAELVRNINTGFSSNTQRLAFRCSTGGGSYGASTDVPHWTPSGSYCQWSDPERTPQQFSCARVVNSNHHRLCFCSEPNLLLGQRVTASSLHGSFDAQYATDGLHWPLQNNRIFHTGSNPGVRWVEVSLRRPGTAVGSVVLWNRGDTTDAGRAINNAKIFGRDVRGNLYQCRCNADSTGHGQPIVRSCGPQPLVSIRVESTEDIILAELEAYPAGISGTYVLIDGLKSERLINLNEVEGYRSDGSKLMAVEAEIYPVWSNLFYAHNCIDGDVTTMCHSAGSSDNTHADPWLMVRFAVGDVPARIVVRNRATDSIDSVGARDRIIDATISLIVNGTLTWVDTFEELLGLYNFSTQCEAVMSSTESVDTATPGLSGLPESRGRWLGSAYDPVTKKVYVMPRDSRSVLIIDPRSGTMDDSSIVLPNGPAVGSKHSWAVVDPQSGKIFSAPVNRQTTSVLIIDPVLNTTDVDALPVSNANNVMWQYGAGIYHPNTGKIIFFPHQSHHLLIIDPSNNITDQSIQTLTGGNSWVDIAIHDPGTDKIFGVALGGNTNNTALKGMTVFDPVTNATSYIGRDHPIGTHGTMAFAFLPRWGMFQSNVLFHLPREGDFAEIFNPATNLTTGKKICGLAAFEGDERTGYGAGVYSESSKKLYFPPQTATKVLVLDPFQGTAYQIGKILTSGGNWKFSWGVWHPPTAQIIFPPDAASSVLRVTDLPFTLPVSQFVVSDVVQNYDDSVEYCTSIGATIASIHSAAEMTELETFAFRPGNRVGPYYLGGRSDGHGLWSWDDGTPWDYVHSQTDGLVGGQETRLAIVLRTGTENDFQWDDWEQGNYSMGVVCRVRTEPVTENLLEGQTATVSSSLTSGVGSGFITDGIRSQVSATSDVTLGWCGGLAIASGLTYPACLERCEGQSECKAVRWVVASAACDILWTCASFNDDARWRHQAIQGNSHSSNTGFWRSATWGARNEWAEVVLQNRGVLGAVRLWNRNSASHVSVNGAVVQGRDSDGNLHQCGKPLETRGPGQPITRTCGFDRAVTSVRVSTTSDAPLQIVELEAFPANTAIEPVCNSDSYIGEIVYGWYGELRVTRSGSRIHVNGVISHPDASRVPNYPHFTHIVNVPPCLAHSQCSTQPCENHTTWPDMVTMSNGSGRRMRLEGHWLLFWFDPEVDTVAGAIHAVKVHASWASTFSAGWNAPGCSFREVPVGLVPPPGHRAAQCPTASPTSLPTSYPTNQPTNQPTMLPTIFQTMTTSPPTASPIGRAQAVEENWYEVEACTYMGSGNCTDASNVFLSCTTTFSQDCSEYHALMACEPVRPENISSVATTCDGISGQAAAHEDEGLSDGEVAAVAATVTASAGFCAVALAVWFFCPKAPFVIALLKKVGLYQKCCGYNDDSDEKGKKRKRDDKTAAFDNPLYEESTGVGDGYMDVAPHAGPGSDELYGAAQTISGGENNKKKKKKRSSSVHTKSEDNLYAEFDTVDGSDGDGGGYLDVSPETRPAFAKKDTVEVAGKGKGKVRFIGPDHRTGEPKVGVRLFKPNGKNNGTVAGHKYFKCEDNHGILTKPEKVSLVNKFQPK